ncbi:MAG: hypothetical protein GY858_00380 [Candidatus Omnitrophica bacterium]|nr:hypothetical protein [Candidatus Omnitrophota bacterium]
MKKGTTLFEFACLGVAACIMISLVFMTASRPNLLRLKSIQTAKESVYNLPAPTTLVPLSKVHSQPSLKGLKIDPNDPFKFEFIIDPADQEDISDKEMIRLVNYFLAALTIPEEDLWVNLSPHEQDRVTSDNLAITDLGKDLLKEDYILKQLVSTLTYPENELGKRYWNKIYKKIHKAIGTTNIPIDTFNKVWIVPETAELVEKGNIVLIDETKLKAMSEEDYLALSKPLNHKQSIVDGNQEEINKISSQVLKEIILPEIERDVNEGENFATLRQMYDSFVLACWFKKKLKDSVFQYYIDQGKIEGIDIADKDAKEKIFNLYVDAYKKGVYDYIKKDYDQASRKKVNRRYYSGGHVLKDVTETRPDAGEIKAAAGMPTKLVEIANIDNFTESGQGYMAICRDGRTLTPEQNEVVKKIAAAYREELDKELLERALSISELYPDGGGAYGIHDPQGILMKKGIKIYLLRDFINNTQALATVSRVGAIEDLMAFIDVENNTLYVDWDMHTEIVENYYSDWRAAWAQYVLATLEYADPKINASEEMPSFPQQRLPGMEEGNSVIKKNLALLRESIEADNFTIIGDGGSAITNRGVIQLDFDIETGDIVSIFPGYSQQGDSMLFVLSPTGMLKKNANDNRAIPINLSKAVERYNEELKRWRKEAPFTSFTYTIESDRISKGGDYELIPDALYEQVLNSLREEGYEEKYRKVNEHTLRKADAGDALTITIRRIDDYHIEGEITNKEGALRISWWSSLKKISGQQQEQSVSNTSSNGKSMLDRNIEKVIDPPDMPTKVAERRDVDDLWNNYDDAAARLIRNQEPVNYRKILGNRQILFMGDMHDNGDISEHLARHAKEFKEMGITHLAVETHKTKNIDDLNEGQAVTLTHAEVGPNVREEELVRAFVAVGIKIVQIDIDQQKHNPTEGEREEYLCQELEEVLEENKDFRVVVLIGAFHVNSEINTIEKVPSVRARIEEVGYSIATVDFAGGDASVPFALVDSARRAGIETNTFMIDLREDHKQGVTFLGDFDFVVHLSQARGRKSHISGLSPMGVVLLNSWGRDKTPFKSHNPGGEHTNKGEKYFAESEEYLPQRDWKSLLSAGTEEKKQPNNGLGGIVLDDLVKADGTIKYNWSPKLINRFKNLKGIRVSTIRDGKGVKALLEKEKTRN